MPISSLRRIKVDEQKLNPWIFLGPPSIPYITVRPTRVEKKNLGGYEMFTEIRRNTWSNSECLLFLVCDRNLKPNSGSTVLSAKYFVAVGGFVFVTEIILIFWLKSGDTLLCYQTKMTHILLLHVASIVSYFFQILRLSFGIKATCWQRKISHISQFKITSRFRFSGRYYD